MTIGDLWRKWRCNHSTCKGRFSIDSASWASAFQVGLRAVPAGESDPNNCEYLQERQRFVLITYHRLQSRFGIPQAAF